MTASEMIDHKVENLSGWQKELYRELRELLNTIHPDMKEDYKWDTAVWAHHGLVCALSAFQNHVKLNFFRGASLHDKHGLINNGFTSKTHRAVDFHEGEMPDKDKLKDLITEAIHLNEIANLA